VYVLSPEVARGSLEEGSRVLDLFVKKVRDTAQHQKLPPPRRNLQPELPPDGRGKGGTKRD